MTWQPLEPSIPHKNGVTIPLREGETQWMNDLYVVHMQRREAEDPALPPMFHLSIRNQDRSARHDWRDFQRIKNQLCGSEYEGIELYPRESELIDTANQYHLWCYPFSIGIGFNQGRKVARQAQVEPLSPGAMQRDPEPVDLMFGGLSSYRDLKEWMDGEPA